jgi:hypothetical protein
VLEVAKVYTKEMNIEKRFSVCIPFTKAYETSLHSLTCKNCIGRVPVEKEYNR